MRTGHRLIVIIRALLSCKILIISIAFCDLQFLGVSVVPCCYTEFLAIIIAFS